MHTERAVARAKRHVNLQRVDAELAATLVLGFCRNHALTVSDALSVWLSSISARQYMFAVFIAHIITVVEKMKQ